MDTATLRSALVAWLDEHAAEVAPPFSGPGTLDEQMDQLARMKRLLFDAGFMQWGWPERVGGKGGTAALRAVVGEEITRRELVVPGYFGMIEVLAPTVIDFASESVAAELVPRLLRGEEMWCQGFSEPGSGSDLSSLSCRARRDGDRFVVSGQKVWTSLSQYSAKCVLLTRTGEPDSRHRGITALLVDMDTPGITVRPIDVISGVAEFAEVFFDDVEIPADRVLGEEDGGWAVAMALLPYERSTSFWYRITLLGNRLQELVSLAPDDHHTAALLGTAHQQLHALRSRTRLTVGRLSAGESLGPETSIDKVLVATAEQTLFETARAILADRIALGDDAFSERWRSDYLYSRAASVYGGTAEIQRNIIARRLLDLGAE